MKNLGGRSVQVKTIDNRKEWARKECFRLMSAKDAEEVFQLWQYNFEYQNSSLQINKIHVNFNIRELAEINNDPKKIEAFWVTEKLKSDAENLKFTGEITDEKKNR